MHEQPFFFRWCVYLCSRMICKSAAVDALQTAGCWSRYTHMQSNDVTTAITTIIIIIMIITRKLYLGARALALASYDTATDLCCPWMQMHPRENKKNQNNCVLCVLNVIIFLLVCFDLLNKNRRCVSINADTLLHRIKTRIACRQLGLGPLGWASRTSQQRPDFLPESHFFFKHFRAWCTTMFRRHSAVSHC